MNRSLVSNSKGDDEMGHVIEIIELKWSIIEITNANNCVVNAGEYHHRRITLSVGAGASRWILLRETWRQTATRPGAAGAAAAVAAAEGEGRHRTIPPLVAAVRHQEPLTVTRWTPVTPLQPLPLSDYSILPLYSVINRLLLLLLFISFRCLTSGYRADFERIWLVNWIRCAVASSYSITGWCTETDWTEPLMKSRRRRNETHF